MAKTTPPSPEPDLIRPTFLGFLGSAPLVGTRRFSSVFFEIAPQRIGILANEHRYHGPQHRYQLWAPWLYGLDRGGDLRLFAARKQHRDFTGRVGHLPWPHIYSHYDFGECCSAGAFSSGDTREKLTPYDRAMVLVNDFFSTPFNNAGFGGMAIPEDLPKGAPGNMTGYWDDDKKSILRYFDWWENTFDSAKAVCAIRYKHAQPLHKIVNRFLLPADHVEASLRFDALPQTLPEEAPPSELARVLQAGES